MTDKKHPPTYYVVVSDNNRWGKAGNLPEAFENSCGSAYPAEGEPMPVPQGQRQDSQQQW